MATPQLTLEEIRGMLIEAGLLGLTREEIESLLAAINSGATGALEAAQARFIEALGPNPLPAAIERATRLAESHARDMLLDLTESTLNSMGARLADAIEQGLGPREIARKLEELQGLDSVRAARMDKYAEYLDDLGLSQAEWERRWEAQFQRELDDRRLTIARTEQRRAVEEANRANAEARGAQYKVWITAGDDRVSEECQSCEAVGWISIDDEFPTGNDQPPNHPNCRCTLSYRTAPPNEDAQERARDRAAATAEAKETPIDEVQDIDDRIATLRSEREEGDRRLESLRAELESQRARYEQARDLNAAIDSNDAEKRLAALRAELKRQTERYERARDRNRSDR